MSASLNQNRRVYDLSEITGSIERMFEKYFENPYWIKAEISALNFYPSSGHCFPQMVEKSGGKVKAQIRATIWKEDLSFITQKFEEETKEKFREGLNIMFLAYVRFSSLYGLSLQIIDIEPLYTLGEMAREKMNTIAALREQGIYNNNRLLSVPTLIKRLAVISVESSKGYNDLVVTLQNNKQGYFVISKLFPAVLQGKGAVESITGQLKIIRAIYQQFDAVAIIRGGGDDVGLACYDNYLLAREVALFPIPVITGIGHSTNETVTEMVACLNKITPTDVAHYVLSGFIEQDSFIRELSNSIVYQVHELLRSQRAQLVNLSQSFAYNPVRILSQEKQALRNHDRMLMFNAQHYFNYHKQKLTEKTSMIRNLDPENVLKRGYAIVKVQGYTPDKLDEVPDGAQLDILTGLHIITGKVEKSSKRLK